MPQLQLPGGVGGFFGPLGPVRPAPLMAGLTTTCYRDIVLADQPVSYWRLGETVGTVAADSIGPNPGTYTGTYTQGQPTLIAADPNLALLVNGSPSGYVSVPDSASLDLGDGPFSIELWAKRNATGVSGYVLNKGTGAYGLYFASAPIDTMTFEKVNTQNNVQEGGTTDANAHHWVVVRPSGGPTLLYKDGRDVTQPLNTPTFVNTANALEIGREASSTAFAGVLDEVAIYNVVLTALQVRTHYLAGVGGYPCSWYPTMAAFFGTYDITDDLAES